MAGDQSTEDPDTKSCTEIQMLADPRGPSNQELVSQDSAVIKTGCSFNMDRDATTLPPEAWDRRLLRSFSTHPPCGYIIRAVTLSRALQGFGKYWHGEITGGSCTVAAPRDLYTLSEPADVIGDFISHNWATSGRLKFLSLCWYYNGTAAVVASLVAAAVVGVLQATLDLRTCLVVSDIIWDEKSRRIGLGSQAAAYDEMAMRFGLGSQVVGALFFAGTLISWHHVRGWLLCRAPQTIFMDRLCISQSNPELKQEGILALAGFLGTSQRLVVLWSPTYFSRLWCVYEIASWLHLKGSVADMDLLPISQIGIVLLFFAYTVTIFIINTVGHTLPTVLYIELQAATACCFCVPKALLILRLMEQHHTLHHQLQSFSVRNAKCFCCTHEHVAPETGEPLACDRQLIEAALGRWFPSDPELGTNPGNHLEAFDAQVRGEVARQILCKTGWGGMSYRLAVLMTLPAWFALLDRLPAWPLLDWQQRFRILLFYVQHCLLVVPLTLQLYLVFCFYITSGKKGIRLGWLQTMALVLFHTVSFMLLYSASWVFFRLDNPWPQMAEAAVLAVATAVAYQARATLCWRQTCEGCATAIADWARAVLCCEQTCKGCS